jgi:lipopolysaccharide transport system ATP-binding protein
MERSGQIAIHVERLAKRYTIGGARDYDLLTERLARLFRASRQEPDTTLWAVRDVSFEVKHGEVLGIIGRNGAGKSTLLKILSRITPPTQGYAEVYGRLASLLEVGTGFHPELTGRENIYLNAAILGMRKNEIDHRFDEIVDFAGVERFIDTPVKHYSSGMSVRLAFSVAAHLEPEILIVDEVLAVGDADFQKKCLGKMGSVARGGRTVLLVTHNMSAVTSLCTRVLFMKDGAVVYDGSPARVVQQYMASIERTAAVPLENAPNRRGNGEVRFTAMRILDASGREPEMLGSGQRVTIELDYESVANLESKSVQIAVTVHGLMGQPSFLCHNATQGTDFECLPARGTLGCTIPKLPLGPGQYTINLYLAVNGLETDAIYDARMLTVEGGDFFGTGKVGRFDAGSFLVEHFWWGPGAESRGARTNSSAPSGHRLRGAVS